MQFAVNSGEVVDGEHIDYRHIPQKRIWEIVQIMLKGYTVVALSSCNFADMCKHLLWQFTKDHLGRLSGGTILHLVADGGQDHREVHFRDNNFTVHVPNAIQETLSRQPSRTLQQGPHYSFSHSYPKTPFTEPLGDRNTTQMDVQLLRYSDAILIHHSEGPLPLAPLPEARTITPETPPLDEKGNDIDTLSPNQLTYFNGWGRNFFMPTSSKYDALNRWAKTVSDSSSGGKAHIEKINHLIWFGETVPLDFKLSAIHEGTFPSLAKNIGVQISPQLRKDSEAYETHVYESGKSTVISISDFDKMMPLILLSILRELVP